MPTIGACSDAGSGEPYPCAPPKLNTLSVGGDRAVHAGIGAGIRERRAAFIPAPIGSAPATLHRWPGPLGTTTTADLAFGRQAPSRVVEPNLIVALSSPTPCSVTCVPAVAVVRCNRRDLAGTAKPDAIGTPKPVARSKPVAVLNMPAWLRVRSLLPGGLEVNVAPVDRPVVHVGERGAVHAWFARDGELGCEVAEPAAFAALVDVGHDAGEHRRRDAGAADRESRLPAMGVVEGLTHARVGRDVGDLATRRARRVRRRPVANSAVKTDRRLAATGAGILSPPVRTSRPDPPQSFHTGSTPGSSSDGAADARSRTDRQQGCRPGASRSAGSEVPS